MSSEKPTTVAAVDAEALEAQATSEVAAASTLDELDAERVRDLGRKSELKQALRQVRDRESGMALNDVRERLEAAVANDDPAEARRLLEQMEFSEAQRRHVGGLIDRWERGRP